MYILPFILFFVFALTIKPCFGVGFYISPSGNDSLSGRSPDQAWQSLGRANQQDFEPGDKLLLEGGKEYIGNLVLNAADAGTADHPVVISSYGTSPATIQAGTGTAVLIENAGGIEVENLFCIGSDHTHNTGSGIAFVNTLPDNRRLSHIRIDHVQASGFGKDHSLYKNKTPGFQTAEGCGIFVGGIASDQSKSGFSDVRITHCTAHDNEYYGILITGYWTENPTTYANEKVYIGYSSAFNNPGDPDFMENHSGSGIFLEDTQSGIIEYCSAHNNGYRCRSKAGGPCGIWAAVCDNVIIQFCESYDNKSSTVDGDGFDFDGGTTNSFMQYNYSHGNDGAGYLIWSYPYSPFKQHNNTIRYNISENDSRRNPWYGSIHIGTGGPPITGLKVYNNTLYMEGEKNGTLGIQQDVEALIANNIFISQGGGWVVKNEGNNNHLRFLGNIYWSGNNPIRILWQEKEFTNLNDWRMATKQETLKDQTVGIQTDPMLLNIGHAGTIGDPTRLSSLIDYQLNIDSPALDKGLDLLSLFQIDRGKQDFFGHSLIDKNRWSIGAYQK